MWQSCIASVLMEPIFSCIREAKYSSKLVKLQQRATFQNSIADP